MKVTKLIETRVDIVNVADMFCSDYNLMVINLLKKKFNGRCYKSVYILDVLELVNRSDIKCKNRSLDGYAYVDVQFKVSCILYENGEIIHNCKIVQILSKNVILAKSTYCSIQIKNPTNIDIFKEGDEIPVIVNDSRYSLFDTEIAISSIPLIPVAKNYVIYLIQESSETLNYENENKETFEEIDEILKEINEFDKKAIKFFVELLYPYKKYKSFDKEEKLSLKDFNKIKIQDRILAGDKYLNENIFYRISKNFEEMSNMNDILKINISREEMYRNLIFDYKKNLLTLLGFLNEYNIEKIKKNSVLWQVYTSLKQ